MTKRSPNPGDFSAVRASVPHAGESDRRVVLIGTYPPTKCGIATHTANVSGALVAAGIGTGIVRLLDRGDDPGPSQSAVAAVWYRNTDSGFDAALEVANAADVVIIQHEFGIYPGPDGQDIVEFADRCSRPIITVLHTVLEQPSRRQRSITEALARRSTYLVVHTLAARQRLLVANEVLETTVVVIPHGAAPNLRGPPLVTCREPLMLSWGLLGPGKGIEHGIEAVALLRDDGLDVRYLIAGGTHPNVREQQGERYRDGLQDLARRRRVDDLVDIDDRYRDWDSLHALVRSATIVLVPYDSRDQVTSGVLVEALAAGKPVVSTAFPHARELEATGAVVVVDHESPGQIASAVRRILVDDSVYERMTAAARLEGARYDWRCISRRFRVLIEECCDVSDQPCVSASVG